MKIIIKIFFIILFPLVCNAQNTDTAKNDSSKLIIQPYDFYSNITIKDSASLFNHDFNSAKTISLFNTSYNSTNNAQIDYYSFYHCTDNSIFKNNYNDYFDSAPYVCVGTIHLPSELFELMGKGLNHLFR